MKNCRLFHPYEDAEVEYSVDFTETRVYACEGQDPLTTTRHFTAVNTVSAVNKKRINKLEESDATRCSTFSESEIVLRICRPKSDFAAYNCLDTTKITQGLSGGCVDVEFGAFAPELINEYTGGVTATFTCSTPGGSGCFTAQPGSTGPFLNCLDYQSAKQLLYCRPRFIVTCVSLDRETDPFEPPSPQVKQVTLPVTLDPAENVIACPDAEPGDTLCLMVIYPNFLGYLHATCDPINDPSNVPPCYPLNDTTQQRCCNGYDGGGFPVYEEDLVGYISGGYAVTIASSITIFGQYINPTTGVAYVIYSRVPNPAVSSHYLNYTATLLADVVEDCFVGDPAGGSITTAYNATHLLEIRFGINNTNLQQ